MTKISYLHGIQSAKVGSIPPPTFIDFIRLTQGEARLQLVKRRLDILSGIVPENAEAYQIGKQIIDENISRGLHTFRGVINENIPAISFVTEEILQAKGRSNLAMLPNTQRVASGNGINGIERDCLRHLEEMNIPRFIPNPKKIKWPWDPAFVPNDAWELALNKCQAANEWCRVINQRMEQSAYFLMYEFANDVNRYPTVAAKKLQHQTAIDIFSQESGIERPELVYMIENGMLASGINRDGLTTYQTFRDGSIEGIRGVSPAAIKKIVEVISIAVGAISGIVAVVSQFQTQAQIKAQLNNAVTASNQPLGNDFPLTQSGAAASSGLLVPLLLGGGALLLLNQNNK